MLAYDGSADHQRVNTFSRMIAQPLKAMATATISNETMSLEATSVRPAQGNGKRRDAKDSTPAPPNEFGRLGRKSLDRIKTTETLKFSASWR